MIWASGHILNRGFLPAKKTCAAKPFAKKEN
jgi:hypothetical protein